MVSQAISDYDYYEWVRRGACYNPNYQVDIAGRSVFFLWIIAVEQAAVKQREDCVFSWYFRDGMNAFVQVFSKRRDLGITIFSRKIKENNQMISNRCVDKKMISREQGILAQ